jgi:DNA-binding NarL/FixJ family response regulator
MSPRLIVLADDLIWASRLQGAAQRAGAEVTALRHPDGLVPGSGGASHGDGAIVDLGGRRYDGIEAIGLATRLGLPVLAVAQHDDIALRRQALAAGAERVFSYNKMHRDGPAILSRWLAGIQDRAPSPASSGEDRVPALDATRRSVR